MTARLASLPNANPEIDKLDALLGGPSAADSAALWAATRLLEVTTLLGEAATVSDIARIAIEHGLDVTVACSPLLSLKSTRPSTYRGQEFPQLASGFSPGESSIAPTSRHTRRWV